jgi:hypothetical protein
MFLVRANQETLPFLIVIVVFFIAVWVVGWTVGSVYKEFQSEISYKTAKKVSFVPALLFLGAFYYHRTWVFVVVSDTYHGLLDFFAFFIAFIIFGRFLQGFCKAADIN